MFKKASNCFFGSGISLLVLTALLMQPIPDAAAQTAKQSKSELKKLQRTISSLQAELKKERSKRSKEEQALEANDKAIATLSSSINHIDKKLKQLNKNLDGYLVNRDSLQQQLDSQLENLQTLLIQRYKMGDKSAIKLLLNQKNPEHVNRMLIYLNKIQQYQTEQIAHYQTLLDKQQQNNLNIDKTQTELVAEKTKLEADKVKIEAARKTRQSNIKSIVSKINQKKSQIKQLAADKKRLERVIATIEKAIATPKKVIDRRPFRQLKGKLSWPVKGKIIRNFGSVENNLAYDGVLISANQGLPVRAVHTGQVVFSDWLRSYGMLLIVDHGSGYLSLYGHNDQLNKKVGDSVASGEVIALVGSSGGNQRSGVYFAIRHNGKSTNPKSWLSGR